MKIKPIILKSTSKKLLVKKGRGNPTKAKCHQCKGKGSVNKKTCSVCKGTGEVELFYLVESSWGS